MPDIYALGDVAQIVDCEHKTAPRTAGEPFGYSVGTPALRGGRIDFKEAKPIDKATFDAWSRRAVLRQGDLILAREAPVGGVAYVDGRIPVCLGQRTVLVRPDTDLVDSRYLHFLLMGPAAQSWMHTRSAGSTVAHLNVKDVRQLPLDALPSLAVQRQIVDVLGGLDDLADDLEQACAQIADLQHTLFRQAWDGVTRRRIDTIGTVVMGQSPPGDTYNETGDGLPFFQGVRDFGLRHPNIRVYCSEPSRRAAAGDILLAVRAPIGNTNVATTDVAIGRGLAVVKATSPATALQALRHEPDLWARFQGTGTVFASISKKDIAGNTVPWPSADIEADLALLDEMYTVCTEEIESLRRTRAELLPLMLAGRVQPGEVAA